MEASGVGAAGEVLLQVLGMMLHSDDLAVSRSESKMRSLFTRAGSSIDWEEAEHGQGEVEADGGEDGEADGGEDGEVTFVLAYLLEISACFWFSKMATVPDNT